MKVFCLIHVLTAGLTVLASPLSELTSSPLTSPKSPSSLTAGLTPAQCQPVNVHPCAKLYTTAQMPNLYGDTSTKVAETKIHEILNVYKEDRVLVIFYCTLYLPPCSNTDVQNRVADSKIVPLPCRPFCEMAVEKAREMKAFEDHPWPVRCQSLPTENCFNLAGSSNVTLVKTSMNPASVKVLPNEVASFASLDAELGNDEAYEVEVQSPYTSVIPERRYDIADLGDPNMFQGWADVQGSGAANDYCRVIGRGKRRFMSCNLAGTTAQGHHYVSQQGFEAGHPNTWFMRDMDGDGRDDYCRCVGTQHNSRMTCMKAGEFSFFGSSLQGGNQHTFSLPGSDGCSNRRYNPAFGESYS